MILLPKCKFITLEKTQSYGQKIIHRIFKWGHKVFWAGTILTKRQKLFEPYPGRSCSCSWRRQNALFFVLGLFLVLGLFFVLGLFWTWDYFGRDYFGRDYYGQDYFGRDYLRNQPNSHFTIKLPYFVNYIQRSHTQKMTLFSNPFFMVVTQNSNTFVKVCLIR